ncbi:hypothetical protein CYMTET_19154, partial [Cymbomonas tetramitiformis]
KAEADDDNFKRFLTRLADPEEDPSAPAPRLLKPPTSKLPTRRKEVVKRKREVALLRCDAEEKRIKLYMYKLEREHSVETTMSLTTESVKKEAVRYLTWLLTRC